VLTVDFEREEDGRWIAEVLEVPGVLAYGATREEALLSVQVLALRVIADRLEHGESVPRAVETTFLVASDRSYAV